SSSMAGKGLNKQASVPGQGNVFIVGLAGPSGSGKSTMAGRVASRPNGHVISMESYSIETNHLPLEERAKLNYDEVCSHRRKVRDITERQRSLEFILWQYKNNVLLANAAVRAARQALFRSRLGKQR